jgi:REP element-mobilizing transposase RayT
MFCEDQIVGKQQEVLMTYWRLYYHLVWGTKNRQPLLTPDVEPIIYKYLRQKAGRLEAIVYALNGDETHTHMVVSIPPKIAVSKFVGQIKATASTRYNKGDFGEDDFFWQAEFGAFSFDRKRLPNFVSYVERQKEHHANGTTIPVLERMESVENSIVKEESTLYLAEDISWRRELEALEAHRD